MDAKFPGQQEDQTPPTSGAEENSDVSTVVIEGFDPASSTASTGDKAASPRSSLRGGLRAVTSQDYFGVLIATIVLTILIGILHPSFFAFSQLTDILSQATFVAILACGMAFLLSMRELDLSVGSIYGLTSMCAALLIHAGVPSWFGALTGLVIGALLGLTNGLLIQLFRLPSIIATLATLSIYRGLVFALSNGNQVVSLTLTDPFAVFVGGSFLGIPTNVWAMIVIVALFTILLHTTPFGYMVRSIGSNPEAAQFSGLP